MSDMFMPDTSTFNTIIDFLLSVEGGEVNDTRDPGGLTKFGISQRSYPNLNIRELTREAAIDIYRQDYWLRCSCDLLPSGPASILLDAAVNQGPTTAIRMLQRSVKVKEDGVVGPATVAAVQAVLPVKNLVGEMVARRSLAYAGSPLLGTYGLGWFRRLSQLHQLALTL